MQPTTVARPRTVLMLQPMIVEQSNFKLEPDAIAQIVYYTKKFLLLAIKRSKLGLRRLMVKKKDDEENELLFASIAQAIGCHGLMVPRGIRDSEEYEKPAENGKEILQAMVQQQNVIQGTDTPLDRNALEGGDVVAFPRESIYKELNQQRRRLGRKQREEQANNAADSSHPAQPLETPIHWDDGSVTQADSIAPLADDLRKDERDNHNPKDRKNWQKEITGTANLMTPKVKHILELIEQRHKGHHRILVSSQSGKFLDTLEEASKRHIYLKKFPAYKFHEECSKEQRKMVVSSFQESQDRRPRFLFPTAGALA